MADADRQSIIFDAWEERGKAQWDPGRGLLPLHIPAIENTHDDDLEFRLVKTTPDGQPIDSIVCEGIVVAGWVDSAEGRNQVAQLAAESQRRHSAALSAGTTSAAPIALQAAEAIQGAFPPTRT